MSARFKLFIGLTLIACAILYAARRHEIATLREENLKFAAASDDLKGLRERNARLKVIDVDPQAMESLRGELPELMRLRAEISRLRPAARQTEAQLQQEVDAARKKVEEIEDRFEREMEGIVMKRNMRLLGGAAHSLAETLQAHIAEHGSFPASLASFQNEFNAAMNQEWSRKMRASGDLPPEFAKRVDIQLDAFELMPPPPGFPSTDKPFLMFREKTPRQSDDGTWRRLYGTSAEHFQVEEADSKDGAFQKWESEFPENTWWHGREKR